MVIAHRFVLGEIRGVAIPIHLIRVERAVSDNQLQGTTSLQKDAKLDTNSTLTRITRVV